MAIATSGTTAESLAPHSHVRKTRAAAKTITPKPTAAMSAPIVMRERKDDTALSSSRRSCSRNSSSLTKATTPPSDTGSLTTPIEAKNRKKTTYDVGAAQIRGSGPFSDDTSAPYPRFPAQAGMPLMEELAQAERDHPAFRVEERRLEVDGGQALGVADP